jgi:hypothetical protein
MKSTFKVPFLATVQKAYTIGAFALGTIVLFGCPVYSGNSGDVVCDSQGNCCDETQGNCAVWNCDYTEQCPSGATCNSGVCTSSNYNGNGYYGDDAGIEAGYDAGFDEAAADCSTTGCPAGQTCTLTNGTAQCLPTSNVPDATVDAPSNTDGSGPTGDATGDATSPRDAGSDAPTFPPFTGCTSDSACADSGVGAHCINGACVAPANQCFDSTQCQGANEECVQGVCTPSCANGLPCPTGYSCNGGDGGTFVCSGNPTPCGAAGETCGAGLTCVDQRCVPLCTESAPSADAGPDAGETLSCSGGLVCVDHGCIPNQAPAFVCNTEGVQDSCKAGSICLHHTCYISCATDGGGVDAGDTVCKTAANFNVCKPVKDSNSQTYLVCGSDTNLGTQCNPTVGDNCSSPAICIDGFCR